MNRDFTPFREDDLDDKEDWGDGIGVDPHPERNLDELPPNSILNNPSPLVKFRLSKKYVEITTQVYKKASNKNGPQSPMVQSEPQEPATIADRMIEYVAKGGSVDSLMSIINSDADPATGDEYLDSLIVYLINKGYDSNLVELFKKEGSALIYFDDRVGLGLKRLKEHLGKLGEVELLARPKDDLTIGAYVFKVTPEEGEVSPNEPEEVFQGDKEKEENFTPKEKDAKKKPKRKKRLKIIPGYKASNVVNALKGVLKLDPKLDLAPMLMPMMKGESTNPQPNSGDVILDTTSKKSYKVLAILGNGIRVQGVEPDDQETVMRADEVKAGISAGRIRKISLDPTLNESQAHVFCPNCETATLKSTEKSEAAFFCTNGCGFELIASASN